MGKSKLIIENSALSWNDRRKYKVNSVVSYNGVDWQNLTGKNSEPGIGVDWIQGSVDIASKLDKVTGVTLSPQVYVKKADGIQGVYDIDTEDLTNLVENIPSSKAVKDYVDEVASKVPKIQFTANGATSTYDILTLALIKAVFWNGVPLNDNDWSQTGTNFTLTFTPASGDIIKPI